jgi:hypothetical protein
MGGPVRAAVKRRNSFTPALLLGAAAGEILGAARTREAALALLDKNRLLVNAGHFAVPGESHWDAMAAWPTAWIGGLFFALTLGIGGTAVAYAWGRLLSPLPRPVRFVLSVPALAPAVWALSKGDKTLAIALLVLALAGLWQAEGSSPESWKERLWSLAATAVLLAGFLPLAPAGGERFTRVRDRLLLPTETGRAVSDFYYRWTLYPAEAIKPLATRTQPVAALDPALPLETARLIASEALALRVLAVPESPSGRGADFRIEYRRGEPVAVAGQAVVPWPVGKPEELRQAFSELSKKSDGAFPLRRATLLLLLGGLPLSLALVFLGLARRLGAAASFAGERAGAWGASVAVLLLAGSLAWAGMEPKEAERFRSLAETADAPEVIRAMASEDPVERLYGVIGAARHGPAAKAQLLERLDDPVLNVRYTAAASLGSAPSPEVKQRLSTLLREERNWYVQERIYAALWRMGWRP